MLGDEETDEQRDRLVMEWIRVNREALSSQVVCYLRMTSFDDLLDEGHQPQWLASLIREGVSSGGGVRAVADGEPSAWVAALYREGVSTLEGIRAVRDGAPVEWVRAFESGEALGYAQVPT